jgi:hypothetical protein
MAGPVPAIHVFFWETEVVDARNKSGHDEATEQFTGRKDAPR